MFDVEKLSQFAIREIANFAADHPDEVFYAFAFDAGLLCFNSVGHFEKQLEEYQQKWPEDYETPQQIEQFKYNPGDWAYQGFASFDSSEEEAIEHGFDRDLYDIHYYAEGDAQRNSEYAKAMNAVLEILKEKDVFRAIKKSPDFRIGMTEHNY